MKSVHVVADSISMHYGPYLEKYISTLYEYSRKQEVIGNMVNPEGPNGGDSSQVLAYLQRCIDQGIRWDVLVVNCGLHDLRFYPAGRHQIDAETYSKNLSEIFDRYPMVAEQMIWVRTTPVIDELHNSISNDYQRFNDDVVKYNEIADSIAISRGIWEIDLYGLCRSMGRAELHCDHIHFAEEVRKIQGAYIAGHITAFFGVEKVRGTLDVKCG